MSLIQDHNMRSDPQNSVEPVEVPRIIQSTPRATTSPATQTEALQAQVQQNLAQPVVAPRGPGPSVTETLTNSAGQEIIAAAATQARQEVDWQRNQLRNAPVEYRAPLYRSNLGTPWTNSLPELTMRTPPGEESVDDKLARYFEEYGKDAPNPFRNALESNNNIVGRSPGSAQGGITPADVQAPAWLQRIVRGASRVVGAPADLVAAGLNRVTDGRMGRRRDGRRPSDLIAAAQIETIERGIANFAGVGGQVIMLSEMATDAVNSAGAAVTGPVFDQTLGRAIFGSPAASAERRAQGNELMIQRRQNDYLAPARQLGAYYGEGTQGGGSGLTGLQNGDFGAYGRGLPGALNFVTDYGQNVVRAGIYSGYRRYRTVEGSLRGESRPHDYAGDFDPLRRALAGNTSQIYSLFDDPEYSPISIQRVRPDWNDPNRPRTARRQAEDLALMAAGFVLDMNVPDPVDVALISRAVRRIRAPRATAATTQVQDVVNALPSTPQAARLNPAQRPQELPPAPTPRALPPGRTNALDLGDSDVLPVSPGPRPLDLSSGAAATPDYEPLFITPDGVSVELPRDMVRRVEDFGEADRSVMSRDFPEERPLIEVDPQRLALDYEARMLDELDPDGSLRDAPDVGIPDDFDKINRREIEELRARGDWVEDEDILENIPLDNVRPRELEGDELSQRGPTAPDEASRQRFELEQASEERASLERAVASEDANRFPAPEDPWQGDSPAPTRLPSETPNTPLATPTPTLPPSRPMRLLAAAEEVIGRAVQEESIIDTPRGLVKVSDEVREAQYRLITNRIAARSIEAVPEGARTPSMRRTMANLDTEFQELRRTIAGREFRSVEPPAPSVRVVEAELPVVPQQTLTPPANPATLYQWSRNLPEGQRIYVADAELVDRSARELTDLARFFGHVDLPRSRVLSGEQIQDLRMQYGSLYSTVGPQIDGAALKRLNVEGVGRVETGRANAVKHEPQATKLVSNDVARDPSNRTATPQDFGEPFTYSQDQLSRLSDDALAEELSGRFSPAEVYRSGRPNRDLADTRNDLLQEVAYRAGDDIDDVLEFFPDDIERYAAMNNIDVADLTRDEYVDLAKRARDDANTRAAVVPSQVNDTLPDSMRSETLSGEAQEAIRDLVVAEKTLEEEMIRVRAEVQLLEELERNTEAPMRALEKATDSNNLLPQTLAQGYNGRTRQEAVDRIADRASAEARNVTRDIPTVAPGDELTDLQKEMQAAAADRVQAHGLRGVTFYHGTRAAVDDIASIDPYRTGRTRQPLGAGEYFYESSEVAESAASAFVGVNDVGHLRVTPQGRVTPVAISVERTLNGAQPLSADADLWPGIRNLIKEALGDDPRAVRNATAAARRKSLPEFYDYISTRLKTGSVGGVDEVAMFEFQTRMSTYFRAQGIEAIVWDGPDGRIVNVLPGRNGRLPIEAGPSVAVSGPRVIDQATGSVNFAQAELRAFGTESARQASEQSAYRFATQLRRQLMERIGEAADRVDVAFDRLIRADDALEEVASKDANNAARMRAEADRQRYQRVNEDLNQGRNCL